MRDLILQLSKSSIYSTKPVGSASRRQRFRKAIPFGFVQVHGRTILEVRAGEIYSRNDILLEEFNRLVAN
ncbi:MAG: hypothetical protein EGQ02_13005 [Enterobacter cloacae]|nr:hypothetical protein [Enterobacter cloacae]